VKAEENYKAERESNEEARKQMKRDKEELEKKFNAEVAENQKARKELRDEILRLEKFKVEQEKEQKVEEERQRIHVQDLKQRETNLRRKAHRLGIDTSDKTYNIAIIGQSGTGKSSFINAFFGEKLAVTGNNECTRKLKKYCPNGSAVTLWDVPGAGTLTQPADAKSYFDNNSLFFFDCLFIVMTNRIRSDDLFYAKVARDYKLKVIFIRSHSDEDLTNAIRDEHKKRIEDLSIEQVQAITSKLKEEFQKKFQHELKELKVARNEWPCYYISSPALNEFLHQNPSNQPGAEEERKPILFDEQKLMTEVFQNLNKIRCKNLDTVNINIERMLRALALGKPSTQAQATKTALPEHHLHACFSGSSSTHVPVQRAPKRSARGGKSGPLRGQKRAKFSPPRDRSNLKEPRRKEENKKKRKQEQVK